MPISTEQLLDKIAEQLILDPNGSGIVTPEVVKENQKKILNGTLQINSINGKLALYQKDEEANEKDLLFEPQDDSGLKNLSAIAEQISDVNNIVITIEKIEGVYVIFLTSSIDDVDEEISYIVNQENNNPLNVSQFIPLQQSSSIVNVEQAEEFLDTNIFELLPTGDTRQSRIVRFFQELNALLPPTNPLFDGDGDLQVDRDEDDNWIGNEEYNQDFSISYAQDNPNESNIDEEDAYFHRLRTDVNDTNSGKTIEDIYERIKPYLTDLLEPIPTPLDERPEYRNQSSGYLQFRNLNQGIVIRNQNQDFIEGLNPNSKDYLETGFTITMWVKFLDKSSEGTLFNFGNPIRGVVYNEESIPVPSENAHGFRLETYVLNKEDGDFTSDNYSNYGEAVDYINPSPDVNYTRQPDFPLVFENSNTARFVRLVVNENGLLRDSHVATGGNGKLEPGSIYVDDDSTGSQRFRRLTTTFIPEDFNEWYFICATYNPFINEDDSDFSQREPNYWLNHIDEIDQSVVNSNLGNRCKVEIISRTDLLRARGFKVG